MPPQLGSSSRRRAVKRRLALALCSGLMAMTMLLPNTVGAVPPYPPDIPWGEPPDVPQQVPSCSTQSWATPRVEVHTSGFSGSQPAMQDAIRDVDAQIRAIGGSTARVESTMFTTEQFHLSPYFDSTPVIHVGFANIYDPDPAAVTWNGWSCEHFITVDNVDWSWNYGTPETTVGVNYYTAGLWDGSGKLFFRVSYLHELLHAFGLNGHPQDVYSFLNYGARPWAHAPEDAMIRPLPYDVQRLRSLYPGSGSRTEVAVLNTWFDAADPDDVTPQKMLCKPSSGNVASASKLFADYCGDGPTTAVCPGDVVQVHYALANYSTASVTVTSNLWLSLDDAWDQNDFLSPTSKVYSVSAASSQNKYWGYEVPSLPVGFGTRTYYVIVRATATTSSGVTVRDSIPMRGTVTVGNECMTITSTRHPIAPPPNP
jgi:hypothetical protein